jgi:CubicO group peptidase (beta-lactamase class C family)
MKLSASWKFMHLKTFIKPGWRFALIAVCGLAVLAWVSMKAQATPVKTADFQELDGVIAAQMQKHGLPGVTVAVIEGDHITYL